MKVIDKFLKKLHTTRNNFATYVLTLISLYLVVDRMAEILLVIFTGVSYSYWGPIKYCLAMACPMLAYAFSVPSEYSTSKAIGNFKLEAIKGLSAKTFLTYSASLLPSS